MELIATSKRILIVDDSQDLRDILAKLFEDNGYTVLLASGGHEAFRLYQMNPGSLVLSDVQMEEGSGIFLLKQIRAIDRTCPIFLMSGSEEINEYVATSMGANGFFPKPFNTKKVFEVVEATVERRKTA